MSEAAVEGEVVVDGSSNDPERLPARVEPAALAVTPQVEATELVARLDTIRSAQEKAMQQDVDYGVVPGTNKPTLFKPGAEKLSVLFQLDVQIDNEKVWDGDHLTVISHATVFHAPSGSRLGYGEGVCTTKERKYAYRRQDHTCPDCGQETVLESKHDPEWFCWKKKGGCGHTFPTGSEKGKQIAAQEIGDKPNPDLPDLWNTVVKMAEKRARVDAVLAVTGASALFTQDMDDAVEPAASEPEQQTADSSVPEYSPEQKQALLLLQEANFNDHEKKAIGRWGFRNGWPTQDAANEIIELLADDVPTGAEKLLMEIGYEVPK